MSPGKFISADAAVFGLSGKSGISKYSTTFIDGLRRKVFELCEGLNPRLVAESLLSASDEVWKAGIDDAWAKTKVKNRSLWREIFFVALLALMATQLEKLRRKRLTTRRMRR